MFINAMKDHCIENMQFHYLEVQDDKFVGFSNFGFYKMIQGTHKYYQLVSSRRMDKITAQEERIKELKYLSTLSINPFQSKMIKETLSKAHLKLNWMKEKCS